MYLPIFPSVPQNSTVCTGWDARASSWISQGFPILWKGVLLGKRRHCLVQLLFCVAFWSMKIVRVWYFLVGAMVEMRPWDKERLRWSWRPRATASVLTCYVYYPFSTNNFAFNKKVQDKNLKKGQKNHGLQTVLRTSLLKPTVLLKTKCTYSTAFTQQQFLLRLIFKTLSSVNNWWHREEALQCIGKRGGVLRDLMHAHTFYTAACVPHSIFTRPRVQRSSSAMCG